MIDLIYTVLTIVPEKWKEMKYRSHARKSGLNIPYSLKDLNTLSNCHHHSSIDYNNFTVSVANLLAEWLYDAEALHQCVTSPETYFDQIEANGIKERTDGREILTSMIDARILREKLLRQINLRRIGGDSKIFVETFNQAMEFYRKLPHNAAEIYRMSSETLESKKTQLIDDALGKGKKGPLII